MNILITGVSGFIGQHLVAALANLGHNIFGAQEPGKPMKFSKHYTTLAMDLRHRESVEDAVKFANPDIVIHLAAKTEVAFSFEDYEDYTRVNYLGTVLLAEACRHSATNLEQFIMASSMETYGHHDPDHGAFNEVTPQKPMAPYSIAKLAAEKYLAYMEYAYGLPYTILRQTNTYGRTNTSFFVMERIITQMLAGDKVELGEPDPVRNFLYISDLMDLYLTILGNERAIGETFVTGPDNGLTIRQLVQKCANALMWKGNVVWHTIPVRPGEIRYLNSDGAKAKRVLGWEPVVPLEEGIALTAEAWRRKALDGGDAEASD